MRRWGRVPRSVVSELVSVSVLGLALGALAAPGVVAQGSNTLHIVLDGGAAPGTYDLTTTAACRPDWSGPGDWAIEVSDPSAAPSSVSVTLNAGAPEWDYLAVDFGTPGAMGARYQILDPSASSATVDDRGDTATLTLTARDLYSADAQGTSVPGGSATVTIECGVIERFGDGTGLGPTPTPPIPTSGDWTGTVTLTATLDHHATDQGESQDADSSYHETWTTDERFQTTATDTHQVVASDPDDVTTGIHEVRLDGVAGNAGSTLETWVKAADTRNAACTWHQEDGTQKQGSWTASGRTRGSLQLFADGGYTIDVRGDTSGPDGVLAPDPQVPYRSYQTISDLTANCEGEGYDTTWTEVPVFVWADRYLGGSTVDGSRATIEGQLDVADPGSVVAGSQSWVIDEWGGGVTLTAEWRLEHEGTITLPQ